LAWQSFSNNPEKFFGRLFNAGGAFLRQLPDFLWRSYQMNIAEPSWMPKRWITLLAVLGIIWVVMRWGNRRELSFWFLMLGSILLSAAFVYFDDGRRTLAASVPLLALFVSMGMAAPDIATTKTVGPNVKLLRGGGGVLLVAALLFLSVPWLASRFSPVESIAGGALSPKANEAIVFGGRRITGFLIVADDAPRRDDVPTLHLSEFKRIVQASDIERYQGLIHPTSPPLPFGFIYAPRLEKGPTGALFFIVPSIVMERGDVQAWRLRQFEKWHIKPPLVAGLTNEFWVYVGQADPLRIESAGVEKAPQEQ
jgi:hypothetical protein